MKFLATAILSLLALFQTVQAAVVKLEKTSIKEVETAAENCSSAERDGHAKK